MSSHRYTAPSISDADQDDCRFNDGMGADFTAGQIVTVFRSRLTGDANPAYGAHADRMSALARTMPGYVDHKGFIADDGERVTIVTFADRKSHDAWRLQADHVEAQRAGIASYYESYSLQVASVERVTRFTRDRGTRRSRRR